MFTGKIINSKDFVVNVHGVLYHESSPDGQKKIDVMVKEKKKVKNKEGGGEYEESKTIAVCKLKLDENNHVIETEVEEIVTSGKSVTVLNKEESKAKQSFTLF